MNGHQRTKKGYYTTKYWPPRTNSQYMPILQPHPTLTTITTMFTSQTTYHTKGLQRKTVSLSYYAAGRHQIISFDTSSPDFRLAIQTLNEQQRPFRIIYN